MMLSRARSPAQGRSVAQPRSDLSLSPRPCWSRHRCPAAAPLLADGKRLPQGERSCGWPGCGTCIQGIHPGHPSRPPGAPKPPPPTAPVITHWMWRAPGLSSQPRAPAAIRSSGGRGNESKPPSMCWEMEDSAPAPAHVTGDKGAAHGMVLELHRGPWGVSLVLALRGARCRRGGPGWSCRMGSG